MTTVKKKKKHRRRYKLVWPFGNKDKTPSKKPKRRIKTSALITIIAVVVGILCIIFVPGAIDESNLKKLGYNKQEIAAIRSQKLTQLILKNDYYSPYLASSILDGTMQKEYIELYNVTPTEYGLDNNSFLLSHRLADKGYEPDQVLNLFKNLPFYEITPLLVFDYQYDENKYIDDCKRHPDNSPTNLQFDGTYIQYYEDTEPVDDQNSIDLCVNKHYYLSADYVPPQLTDLSIQIAAADRQLAQVAADALADWSGAGQVVGVRFYAASAYRSYDSQVDLYNSYVTSMGQEQTDAVSARPGFSEHQSGYTVDLAAVGEDDAPEFADTNAFRWAVANCMDYGWILRYPEGKSSITGYSYESWHYRYLGVDLAKAVTASNLTYDEYYALYLKPWADETNKPSEEVINAANPLNQTPEPDASASPSSDTQ